MTLGNNSDRQSPDAPKSEFTLHPVVEVTQMFHREPNCCGRGCNHTTSQPFYEASGWSKSSAVLWKNLAALIRVIYWGYRYSDGDNGYSCTVTKVTSVRTFCNICLQCLLRKEPIKLGFKGEKSCCPDLVQIEALVTRNVFTVTQIVNYDPNWPKSGEREPDIILFTYLLILHDFDHMRRASPLQPFSQTQ